MNGQLHAPAALTQWEEPPVHFEQNLGAARSWCRRSGRTEKSLAPTRKVTTILRTANGNMIVQIIVCFFNQTF
jgi:hypothetical protein